MYSRNLEIRDYKKHIPNWLIAEKLGIHENTFYRWMRLEMTESMRSQVIAAIDEVKKEIEKA
ncbi:hypothetical protein [Neobacillus bataviensis]|uniref:hypothetical protein n=1 Tax=Neobacillus bataviensis TaxID=220685 RepID=UPI001CBD6E0C|nr:hypothetical protein [Neobacillus bataviensis]